MSEPEVSFIIPCYRSRQSISLTLGSIRAQKTSRSFEILVVESSADGTAQWLRDTYPEVRVVESAQRLLPGQARNRGVESSRGAIIAFLDADVRAEPEWLETLCLALQQERIGIAAGWVKRSQPFSTAGRILYWIEFAEYMPGHPSGHRRALPSCNWLLLRDEFLASGGFDDSMAMSEDLVLCRSFSHRLYFVGATGVWHPDAADWSTVRSKLETLGYWSGIYRRCYRVEGSWLARFPLLSYGLPLLRSWRIVKRTFRAQPREGLSCLLRLPLLGAGLLVWSRGFRRGLEAGEVEGG